MKQIIKRLINLEPFVFFFFVCHLTPDGGTQELKAIILRQGKRIASMIHDFCDSRSMKFTIPAMHDSGDL